MLDDPALGDQDLSARQRHPAFRQIAGETALHGA